MSTTGSANIRISNNNFDIVRLILALVVVFSHIRDLNDINSRFFAIFSGDFAVECFFVISGYLIIRSFKKKQNIRRYIFSRGMRILPMYYVSIVSFFFILFFISHLSVIEYLKEGGIRYLIFNGIFLNFIQPSLPGVFVDNPRISAVNGALWTIKVEILFYIFVPFFVLFVKKLNRYIISIFMLFILLSIAFKWGVTEYYQVLHIPEQLANQLPAVLSYFLLGGLVNYLNLSRVSKKIVFLLLIVSAFYLLLSNENSLDFFVRPFAIAGFILPICLQRNILINIPEKIGDLSYGIYVTHFPLIQLLIAVGLYDSLWLGVCLTFTILFILSFISWHFIEKPALRFAKTAENIDL
ncbi:acyltransferase family protein [Escherichia albertii]